jgi:SprT protein
MQNTKDLIEDRVLECMAIVRSKFPNTSFENPSVHFDIVGTKGGCAKFKDWSLHFNLKLAEANLQEYLSQVVPHEIAHLVDFKKYNGWGHKRTWKHIMIHVFSLTPDRCHQMDTSEVKTKKYDTYIYVCSCPDLEIKVKSNLHKKMQVLGRNYKCVNCKTRIAFKVYLGKT